MSTSPDTLAAALALHAAGCSVVPVRTDGSKHPQGTWKTAQTERATEEQLRATFAHGHPGIGIVCGAVSGGLEMLELEGRAVAEGELTRLAEIFVGSGLTELWERIATGWLERSPSGGLHFHYLL
ncbi:MAG TPA: bifunctional DNA primase/polymerase, partial [Streptomyces sp.]|nr:bifunctional DNA primase/polymerase [Streptomyces sp.]